MKTAHDLFLPEEARDQKPRRSVADIIAEDDADQKRLAGLAETTIFYQKLSRLKSTCAWFMLHKRITATALSVAVLGVVAASVVNVGGADNIVISEAPVVTKAETEAKIEKDPTPPVKAPQEPKADVASSDLGAKSLQDALTELNSSSLEPHKSNDQLKVDQGGKAVQAQLNEPTGLPLPALKPITEVQVREQLDTTNPKIDVAPPSTVGSIAVPISKQEIVKADKDSLPVPTASASDIIDQFGFGTEPKPVATEKVDDELPSVGDEDLSESAVPIPVAKPQNEKPAVVEEVKDVRYRIVDRDKETAGFRRMKDQNPATTQWFLVIEAVDVKGKAIPMPVMSMDTGEVKAVTKWAVQVSEKDFMKFSDEKKKTGKIANPIIGTAPTNQTEPKWSVKLTGNMLTEWE